MNRVMAILQAPAVAGAKPGFGVSSGIFFNCSSTLFDTMSVILSPNEGAPGPLGPDIAGGFGTDGGTAGLFLLTDFIMAGAKMIAGIIKATITMT